MASPGGRRPSSGEALDATGHTGGPDAGRPGHRVRERSYFAFRGIPYAASPTGERWLREPDREARWDGVRPAQSWGATAPQRKQRVQIIPELLVPGPDYLNVNVFTPDLAACGLPVLVWIHGGAFVMGTALPDAGLTWVKPTAEPH